MRYKYLGYYYVKQDMTSIITYTEFLDSGLPLSDDISTAEVEMAIHTVEQFYLKDVLTPQIYADILANPSNYTDVLSGNGEVAGLKMAMFHLVFAYMLYDNTRLTRYSAVIKNDEHSDSPSREDLLRSAKHHWEIGSVFTLECSKYLAVDVSEIHNDFVFNELVY